MKWCYQCCLNVYCSLGAPASSTKLQQTCMEAGCQLLRSKSHKKHSIFSKQQMKSAHMITQQVINSLICNK